MSTTRRLYGLLLPYRSTLTIGLTCLILSVVAELYPPLIWQRVIDEGVAQRDWNFIAGQLVLLIMVFALGQVFAAVRGVLLERAGQQLMMDLRLRLYEHVQRQSVAYTSTQRTGDLISRISADVESLQDVMVRGSDSIIANALRLAGVIGIFIYLHPPLGLLTTIPMLLVGLLLLRYNKRVRPFYRAAREQLGLLTARFADNIGGMRVIQAFAREHTELAAVRHTSAALYDQQVQAVIIRNRVFPVIRWIANFGNVIMLGGGVYFILRGEFTIGGLLAYRGYGRYFYGPIDDLVNINDLIQRAGAAGRRVFELLDAPITIEDAPNARDLPRPLRGDICFTNVSFGYDPARPVLHAINLRIHPGERVAILGPSGVGKSTLLSLIARLYDPTDGMVTIDGMDLRTVTLSSLRGQIGQVQQETFLFNTTVLENLRYGRPDAPQADVEAAARAANAHEFICELPKGYNTIVGERGVKLSGGQKQRIAVARALLANTPLLLLDEPTSAVEPESEAAIIAGLETLMRGRTTLIVSHRLSLARSADRVLVVANGRMSEQGTPAELLADPNSHFSAMVRADSAFI